MSKRTRAGVRVGVAGWDYRDWKGVVYPQRRPSGFDPLRYLSAYLDLVEINSTFYGPPRAAVARRWVQRIAHAAGFRFTAKLWRRFTHERQAPWTRSDVRAVRRGFDVLLDSGRLDAILIQFPWSFRNADSSREWLDDVVTAFHDYPLVLEVRHESWNEPDTFRWLMERHVGFVNLDQPRFRRSIGPSARLTSGVGYVRVHGRNYADWFRKDAGRDARYDYLYDEAELRPWVRRTKEVAAQPDAERVDVVFNNHYRGKAVVNALQFRRLLEGGKVAAPPPLMDHYGAELAAHAHAAEPDGAAA
jgi:uncharacterized protein YecE (DUF72 family)